LYCIVIIICSVSELDTGLYTAYPGVAYPRVAYPRVAYPGVAYPGVAYPRVAYPGVRDNRSTLNTKTGYDDEYPLMVENPWSFLLFQCLEA